MKKIGILGSGTVGKTLAEGFLNHGYQVTIGSGHPDKLKEWNKTSAEDANIGTFEEASAFGDIIVLAVKGHAAKDLIQQVRDAIENKTIIDACNPIDESTAPVNGVLHFFTEINRSLMEDLQEINPNANFVKCFSCVGAHLMVNPTFGSEQKPTMFIAGNNKTAKLEVKEILDLFGWEVEDMGSVEAARAIEPLCMLWCIPGIKENQWTHAFKLLK
ncbi:MAG: NAD(P)-binding domain-containing protein [Bacteroidota bacterium]